MKQFWIIFIATLVYFLTTSSALAFTTNMNASVVIGQPNFTSGDVNRGGAAGANTLSNVYDSIVIKGKLVVTDYNNNRVLVYNTIPTANNAPANVVIGQTNFTDTSSNQGGAVTARTLANPWSLATDGTKLIISDYENSRVLIYNTVPTSNNAAANIVLGQADFTSGLDNRGGTPRVRRSVSPMT